MLVCQLDFEGEEEVTFKEQAEQCVKEHARCVRTGNILTIVAFSLSIFASGAAYYVSIQGLWICAGFNALTSIYMILTIFNSKRDWNKFAVQWLELRDDALRAYDLFEK